MFAGAESEYVFRDAVILEWGESAQGWIFDIKTADDQNRNNGPYKTFEEAQAFVLGLMGNMDFSSDDDKVMSAHSVGNGLKKCWG